MILNLLAIKLKTEVVILASYSLNLDGQPSSEPAKSENSGGSTGQAEKSEFLDRILRFGEFSAGKKR